MTIRDVWALRVRERAEHPFLIWEDPDAGTSVEFTYAQMDARVREVALMMRQYGVGLGDRVVVQLCNEVEFVDCFLALAMIGGVLVPMSPTYTVSERDRIIEAAKPALLVCGEDSADDLGLWCGPTVVVGRDRLGCDGVLDDLPELTDESLFEIMFTSGTTGDPKGVMMTHANAVFSGEYVNWELSMIPEDRYLTSMVATHVNMQLSALMPVITAGATLILERRYSARSFWSRVIATRATLVQGMAMMVRTLMIQPVAPDERNHHLRLMHYFLPLCDKEKAEFVERFGVELLNNYGLTECLIGAVTDFPDGDSRWPSVGKAGPGYEVRITRPDGTLADPNEPGEIQLRGVPGVSLMAGYYERDDLTAAAIHDGWLATGDCGYMDADGWVYFMDRYTELIKRSGVNISALEVERAISRHPGVEEVAVVGVPDPVRDQAVKAVVVVREGFAVTADDIIATASESLSAFKVPTIVEFQAALPRGEYAKVLKNQLVDPVSLCGDAGSGVRKDANIREASAVVGDARTGANGQAREEG